MSTSSQSMDLCEFRDLGCFVQMRGALYLAGYITTLICDFVVGTERALNVGLGQGHKRDQCASKDTRQSLARHTSPPR